MKAFGGFPYKQVEFDSGTGIHYYSSARVALLDFLLQAKAATIFIPNYVCNNLVEPLQNVFNVKRYSIGKNFLPECHIELGKNQYLIYVNYFGVCDKNVTAMQKRYDHTKLIIDNSQSMNFGPLKVAATIYSPRKFLPIPDGGILITDHKMKTPSAEIKYGDEFLREMELGNRQESYDLYLLNENKFRNAEITKMSLASRSIFNLFMTASKFSIDRLNHFNIIHEKLSNWNRLSKWFAINRSTVPLCYPLLFCDRIAKEKFIQNEIYIPTYWPDVDVDSLNEFETCLKSDVIYLPLSNLASDGDCIDYRDAVAELLGI